MKKNTPDHGYKPEHPNIGQKHQVHIIGGRFKRSKLPVADCPGLRPTPQRVRETLFNWLGQDLSGKRCLDAFGGSGALGFEALSRGAQEVWLIERNPSLVSQLKLIAAKLQAHGIHIEQGDGIATLKRTSPSSLDIVFLDPPFDADVFNAALLAASTALATDGLIYLEAPKRWGDEQLASVGLCLQRYLKAGAVHAHLLRHATIITPP